MCGAQVFWRQMRTSLDEAFSVERDAAIRPTGIPIRTGHDESVTDLVFLRLIRFTVSPANGFEVIASLKAHDLCVHPKYEDKFKGDH